MHYASVACLVVFGFAAGACDPDGTSGTIPAVESPWTVLDWATIDNSAAPNVLSGQCLTAPLPTTADGGSRCVVIDATVDSAGPNHCTAPGRKVVPFGDAPALKAANGTPVTVNGGTADFDNYCELTQLEGPNTDTTSPRYQCANDANASLPNGWCYVDLTATPPFGDPGMFKACPADAQAHGVRYVGVPAAGATTEAVFLVCPP